jgi:hypothetical protein
VPNLEEYIDLKYSAIEKSDEVYDSLSAALEM